MNLIQKLNNNQQIQRYFDNLVNLLRMDHHKFNEYNVEEIAKCALLASELKSAGSKYVGKQMDENGALYSNRNEFFSKV